MLKINNQNIIQFFKERPNLDVEDTIEMLLNIYKNVECNIQHDTNNSQHSVLLEHIQKTLHSLENKADNNTRMLGEIQKDIKENSKWIMEKMVLVLSEDRDRLIQQIRDTMKSNNLDSHKEMKELLNDSQAFLNKKLEDIIGKTDTATILQSIDTNCLDLKREINEIIEDNRINDETIHKIESIIVEKYKTQEKIISAVMDTYFKTRETNEHAKYSDIITKLEFHERVRERQEKMMDNVDKYFSCQLVSSSKGKQGEKRMLELLNELHPDAVVEDTSGKTGCGDVILKKAGKPDILFDTKDYKTSVPTDQIDKITRDMRNNECHGILVSHHSGISTKKDMYIGEDNRRIIVCIHYCNYSAEKIAMAINTIYHLDKQLKSLNITNGSTISDDILEKINTEYKVMAQQKETIIRELKENTDTTIKSITNMNISTLSSYLNEKYQNTNPLEYICTICNNFSGKNAKSLSAHQGVCKKRTTPPHTVNGTPCNQSLLQSVQLSSQSQSQSQSQMSDFYDDMSGNITVDV